MKVLHIAKYYHPFRGGIEKVIQELSQGTVKAGHEVTVLSASVDNKRYEETIAGVKVVRLPRLAVAYSQPITLSLFWEIRKYLQWADIAHMHTPNPLAELAYVVNGSSCPLITTYHCDVIRQRRLMTFYRPVAQQLLQRSDRIVVATPNHLQFSEALQPHLAKCEVVPFGLEAQFSRKTLAVNNHLKRIKDEHGEYFLFVGRLVPYKGVDILLRAIAKANKKLICIGTGPRWEAWHEHVRHLGLQQQVKFLGHVEDDELAAYIHGCQSVVLPSVDESEAFGIVLIEAMACGKPVITTRLRSGVSWVNDAGVTGIEVPPREYEPLAQALCIMADNQEMRLQMGAQARQRFEKLFQLPHMINSYENVYLASLEQARTPVIAA